MADQDKLAVIRAAQAWPDGVPLAMAGAGTAKAAGRTTPAQREALRAAGWTAGSAGWWLAPARATDLTTP